MVLQNGNLGIGHLIPHKTLTVCSTTIQNLGFNHATLRLESIYVNTLPPSSGHCSVKIWDLKTDAINGSLKFDYGSVSDLLYPPWDGNADDISTNTKMIIDSDGNVGIGTTDPHQMLHVAGNILLTSPTSGNGSHSILFGDGEQIGTFGNWGIEYFNGGLNFWKPWGCVGTSANYHLFLKDDGNVGIGTSSPSEKLTVKGKVKAEAFEVVYSVGADYVFDVNYDLKSLYEVENYIKAHKHLSGVPSSAEMTKNGFDLGEMNMILLKKIEEHTLYIIELHKQIKTLQIELNELKNR